MHPLRYRIFFLITVLSFFSIMPGYTQNKAGQRLFYQITLYHFATAAQEAALDNYLAKAYIPALHRAGIQPVGVFKPLDNDTAADKRIYVLVPLKTMQELLTLPQQLQKDAAYLRSAAPYLDAAYDKPPYTRLETILLHAFPLAPVLTPPALKSAKNQRVYELRSYESATEALNLNKVHMFNEGGEIALFRRLGFNAVFYGEVIAGSRMPNLMYMTSFENMDAHDAHWQAFGNDAEWKALSGKKVYQNNVSRHEITLTRPADYSDY
jgi:hypothetical protein